MRSGAAPGPRLAEEPPPLPIEGPKRKRSARSLKMATKTGGRGKEFLKISKKAETFLLCDRRTGETFEKEP
jgi:hypothetical protein